MKLLNDERIEREEGEVRLTMRPITTSQQARLVELGSRPGISARTDLSVYCLNTLVEKINISGVDYKPGDLANKCDLSDPDTLATLLTIGEIVTNAAFAKDDDLKK